MKPVAQRPAWLSRMLIGFGLASLCGDLGQEITNLILPAFLMGFVASGSVPLVLGLIMGLSELFASYARIASGLISDRHGYKKALIFIGYSLSGIFLGMMGFSRQVWQIGAARVMAWVGKGLREAPRDDLIAGQTKPEYYGRAFGFHRSLDTLGSVLGPLVVFFLVYTIPLRSFFWVTFIPGAAALVILYVFIGDIKPVHVPSVPTRKELFNLPTSFRLFLGILTLFGLGYYSKTLVILRAQELLGGANILEGVKITALLYALFSVVRSVSEYCIGYVSDRMNKQVVLGIGGYVLFAVLSFILSFNITSVYTVMAVFILMGVSAGTVKVTTKAIGASLLDAKVRTTGFALMQLVEGIGLLVASSIVGLLWSMLSYQWAFGYAACVCMVAAVMLLFVLSWHKDNDKIKNIPHTL